MIFPKSAGELFYRMYMLQDFIHTSMTSQCIRDARGNPTTIRGSSTGDAHLFFPEKNPLFTLGDQGIFYAGLLPYHFFKQFCTFLSMEVSVTFPGQTPTGSPPAQHSRSACGL